MKVKITQAEGVVISSGNSGLIVERIGTKANIQYQQEWWWSSFSVLCLKI
jgi:hypothetical protein